MAVCVHLSINCTWLNGVSGMGMKHKIQMTISRTVVNLLVLINCSISSLVYWATKAPSYFRDKAFSYYIYKENLQLRKQEAYFLIKGVCLLLSPYFRIMRNKRFTFRDSRQKQ